MLLRNWKLLERIKLLAWKWYQVNVSNSKYILWEDWKIDPRQILNCKFFFRWGLFGILLFFLLLFSPCIKGWLPFVLFIIHMQAKGELDFLQTQNPFKSMWWIIYFTILFINNKDVIKFFKEITPNFSEVRLIMRNNKTQRLITKFCQIYLCLRAAANLSIEKENLDKMLTNTHNLLLPKIKLHQKISLTINLSNSLETLSRLLWCSLLMLEYPWGLFWMLFS